MMGIIRALLFVLLASLLSTTAFAAPKACPDFQLLAVSKHLQDSDPEDTKTQAKQQAQELEVAENEKPDPQKDPKATKATRKKSGGSRFKGLFDSLIPSNLKNNSN